MRFMLPGVLTLVLLSGCGGGKAAPYQFNNNPFLSQVTVTGNAVPGALIIREASLKLVTPATGTAVATGEKVAAKAVFWINGHGEFVGHWEADGQVIDSIRVSITYGETLEITLSGAFPTDRPGDHEVRFVVEKPALPAPIAPLIYRVVSPFS